MPAGKTYIKIASQSASSSSSITFSNIPQNYTDLIMVINAQAGTSGEDFLMRFNGDTGNNYSNIWLRGLIAGTTSGQQEQTTSRIRLSDGGSSTTSNMSLINVNIQKYSTGIVKQVMSRANNAPRGLDMFGSRWNSTSAITSITILMSAGVISSGTFTLYGIECAKSPKATGGDKVYTTGTHWVHEFHYSGLFVPQVALTVDYLVVGGGGGGGNTIGYIEGAGGGGAGGFRTSIGGTQLSLNANTGYFATVGAGGAGSNVYYYGTTQGGSSTFSSITSAGGGFGSVGGGGGSGGSGGGGGGDGASRVGGSGNNPSTSPSQGNNGGSGFGHANFGRAGGGGGGAGAVGSNASDGVGGNGGAGATSTITGSTVTYAGGGGGSTPGSTQGSGGAGGGGAGSKSGNATSGTANTGGGGGGYASDTTVAYSGNGGSGIVIVRYPV